MAGLSAEERRERRKQKIMAGGKNRLEQIQSSLYKQMPSEEIASANTNEGPATQEVKAAQDHSDEAARDSPVQSEKAEKAAKADSKESTSNKPVQVPPTQTAADRRYLPESVDKYDIDQTDTFEINSSNTQLNPRLNVDRAINPIECLLAIVMGIMTYVYIIYNRTIEKDFRITKTFVLINAYQTKQCSRRGTCSLEKWGTPNLLTNDGGETTVGLVVVGIMTMVVLIIGYRRVFEGQRMNRMVSILFNVSMSVIFGFGLTAGIVEFVLERMYQSDDTNNHSPLPLTTRQFH